MGVVPNVIGETFGVASSHLRAAGFHVQTERGCDTTGTSDLHEVYAQSPGGGSQAEAGSTVTITYQAGATCD
jgi:beta-lactam-binding protein with PASTA domain